MYVKNNHPQALSSGKTLIGFNWVGGKEQEGDLPSFDSRSAINSRDTVGVFPECSERDVEKAIRAAGEALPAWQALGLTKRLKLLEQIGQILEQQAAPFTRIMAREVALGPQELQEEWQEALQSFARLNPLKGALKDQLPMGVIGILSPAISPLAAMLRLMLPPLLAGNTVVIKPSSNAPSVAYLLSRCCMDGHLPPGVINIVHGRGHGASGKAMLESIEKRRFQGFAFAGSPNLGRTIAKTCALALVPCHLDAHNGGLFLIGPGADLAMAVKAALHQGLKRSGQGKLALANIWIQKELAAPFRKRLVRALESAPIGNSISHPQVLCGPLASQRVLHHFESHWADGRAQGGELLTGGGLWKEENRVSHVLGDIAKAAYVQPCLWTGLSITSDLVQTKTLGPTLNLLVIESLEEALSQIQLLSKAAFGAFFGQDLTWMHAFQNQNRCPIRTCNEAWTQINVPGRSGIAFSENGLISGFGDDGCHKGAKMAYSESQWDLV